MARQTKRGICELCGAHTNVGTNHGSKVCTNCTHVQSALSKRPQSVANAIRAMGKTEELLGHLSPGELVATGNNRLLREISGIVGYDGEDPAELVEAVRKRALTCAACDAEDVLHEIREIVGYTPDQGDKGLEDAVRDEINKLHDEVVRIQASAAYGKDCAACTALKGDLLQACELDLDLGTAQAWDYVVAAAIQTIAELTNRRGDLLALLSKERADNARLYNEVARLSGQTHSESDLVAELRDVIDQLTDRSRNLHARITLAEQSRDEWEQRAVQAESNVETLEAELRNREDAPATPSASTTYLLDIALHALRGEGPDADQLATLIDAARRAA